MLKYMKSNTLDTIENGMASIQEYKLCNYLILDLRISRISSRASLNALMMTVGCICCSRKGSATDNTSPPLDKKHMTYRLVKFTQVIYFVHGQYSGRKTARLSNNFDVDKSSFQKNLEYLQSYELFYVNILLLTKNDNRCCAITNFFILCTGNFNHRLCSWVLYCYLQVVIRQNYEIMLEFF